MLLMLVIIAFTLILIWLIVLSFIIFKTKRHYHRLITTTKRGSIDAILEKLLEDDKIYAQEIEQIKKEVVKIEDKSCFHFQKFGIIRFNPFERIGGEQSFVLSLLNKLDSGVVINFIYTHEGIRVYAKQIKLGKGVEYELSEEEKKAIKKASDFIS